MKRWHATTEFRWAVTTATSDRAGFRELQQKWELWIEHNGGCHQRADTEWRAIPEIMNP